MEQNTQKNKKPNVKKTVKYFFIAVLVIIIAALVVRVILSEDKSVFDTFAISEESISAYAESGTLSVETLDLKERISENGYFSAYSLFIVKETGEVQVTVRYNVGVKDYAGVSSDSEFEFLLLRRKNPVSALDKLTSDEEVSENDNILKKYDGEYFHPSSIDTDSRYGLYTYKKLTFEDVNITEEDPNGDEFVLVMVPTGTTPPSPDDDALTRYEQYTDYYDCQILHYTEQPYETYKLTKKNLSVLAK